MQNDDSTSQGQGYNASAQIFYDVRLLRSVVPLALTPACRCSRSATATARWAPPSWRSRSLAPGCARSASSPTWPASCSLTPATTRCRFRTSGRLWTGARARRSTLCGARRSSPPSWAWPSCGLILQSMLSYLFLVRGSYLLPLLYTQFHPVSIAVIALNVAYVTPSVLRCTVGRKRFRPGPFSLGWMAYPAAAIALFWVCFAVCVFSLPQAYPVTFQNLNYAGPCWCVTGRSVANKKTSCVANFHPTPRAGSPRSSPRKRIGLCPRSMPRATGSWAPPTRRTVRIWRRVGWVGWGKRSAPERTEPSSYSSSFSSARAASDPSDPTPHVAPSRCSRNLGGGVEGQPCWPGGYGGAPGQGGRAGGCVIASAGCLPAATSKHA